ncbi:MAG: CNNM domain-containing protein [Lactobacillales bacterium]|jgi:Mg2+/Co2+ transporter CorB|nr:CNNM domain-containing protein [Lactobacillales bacterium]
MIFYILLLFLLLCSFFFSGAETALTAVSPALLHDLEKQGNLRAQKINRLKKEGSKLIGTLLLGNNIVNIAITAIATSLLIEAFGDYYGVIIATFGVSFVVLVFSEILPKTYALSNPLSFSLAVTPVILFIVKLLSPIVRGLNWISAVAMKLLPHSETKASEMEMKAEIRGAIEMKAGNMPQEKGMMKSVLDLSEVTVEDIMVHRSKIVSLNMAMSLQEVFDFVSRSPYSRIPLWKGKRDNIIGVLHSKSVLKAMNAFYGQHYMHLNLLNYATKPWFVLNTTTLLDQLHAFKKKREHFAFVVDEYGELQGLVTLEDVLEEIVGDISDESDVPEQATLQVVKTDSGAYRLEGSATIRDINRHFKWSLPDEEAATLAGFLMYETERIPGVGQSFVIDGFTFTVSGKEKNRITYVDVIPPEARL